jgi:hypothetical protein
VRETGTGADVAETRADILEPDTIRALCSPSVRLGFTTGNPSLISVRIRN